MISEEILGQLNTTEEKLIAHLDRDVRDTFSTMVGVTLSQSNKTDTVTLFKKSVSGLVGFAGNFNGMISISTSKILAMDLTSHMLGMTVTKFDDEVCDALGEIANVIGGSFKHHFVNNGHEVRLSTPSVVSGEEYIMTVGTPNTLALMFTFSEEDFIVCVFLEAVE